MCISIQIDIYEILYRRVLCWNARTVMFGKFALPSKQVTTLLLCYFCLSFLHFLVLLWASYSFCLGVLSEESGTERDLWNVQDPPLAPHHAESTQCIQDCVTGELSLSHIQRKCIFDSTRSLSSTCLLSVLTSYHCCQRVRGKGFSVEYDSMRL